MTSNLTDALPVIGFEKNYLVSKDGTVFSLLRNKTLSKRFDRYGYIQYALRKNGKYFYRTAHSLVAEAFIGPRPEGLEVRHKNGIPNDNRVENLEYGTHKENMEDMKKHGRHYSYFREGKRAIDFESEG